jgi:hypothetical protein
MELIGVLVNNNNIIKAIEKQLITNKYQKSKIFQEKAKMNKNNNNSIYTLN